MEIKPPAVATRSLTPVALGTALVLVTYVTPIATIPTTAADLGAGPVARAWILSSMSVGLAASLLATGVLGDTLGRRRVLGLGLVTMAAGSSVCAVANGPWVFVAARVVEGVGGAAVLACGLAVLAHDYAGPRRVHATSVWGASVGLGIAVGGLLSALLDVGSGWRASYVVVGLAALLLLWPTLRRVGESAAAQPRRVDVPGLVLLAVALTTLVSALTQGRNGIDPPTLVLGALALVSAVAFVVVESRVSSPLVDPDLLRAPRFRAATIGSATLGAGMIGMASFVPTLTQVALGASLWTASWLVVAWAGTSVVTAYLVRHLRRPVEGGRAIAGVFVLVAFGQLIGYGGHLGLLAVSMVVAGVGTGVLNAVLGRDAVASVPPDRAAMGSGANNTARYTGAACGITLFVVLATHTGATLVDGWHVAVLASTAITLLGAAAIALSTGRGRMDA